MISPPHILTYLLTHICLHPSNTILSVKLRCAHCAMSVLSVYLPVLRARCSLARSLPLSTRRTGQGQGPGSRDSSSYFLVRSPAVRLDLVLAATDSEIILSYPLPPVPTQPLHCCTCTRAEIFNLTKLVFLLSGAIFSRHIF
ncbi:hypothetical protein F5X98DRAFT_29161 [Xylaria grammica]|nr:hypothetical protein F5X98DRAFT_29161 [Xylaria grammica]